MPTPYLAQTLTQGSPLIETDSPCSCSEFSVNSHLQKIVIEAHLHVVRITQH